MTSMAIFSAFKGYLAQERTRAAYQNTIYFQVVLNLVSIGILFTVNLVDWRGGKMLNLPENSERARQLKEDLDKRFDVVAKAKNQDDDKKTIVETTSETLLTRES